MRLNKKTIYSLLTALLVMFSTSAVAQKVNISPKPQVITWGNNVAFENNVAYSLTGEKDADVDAVNLLKKHFNTSGGNVEIVIGERGDAAIEAAGIPDADFPETAEGYYLSINGKKVVIAGNDERGTYYGVQSFIQIASQPQVMEVTISDFPSVVERGLVEGYYGNPYSKSDRMDLFEFFGRQKMNIYIYGPKDDVYHKGKWREPYPTALGNEIAEYAKVAKSHKVDFVWAIHPGVDIKWTKADSVNIVNKLKSMYDLGIRTFAVFFDDIWGDGTDPTRQAGLMNYITEELNNAYDDVNPLILCPTQYNKGWTSGNYLNILGTKMDKSVRIMWTGNSVVDMIGKDDMDWINNQISRKAYIWLNYPVTDYCINHLLMGPTYGNDLNIAETLSGFTSNPMEYAMASKLSLYSIGDYCWNMPAYDSDASWEEAITYLMPKNREAFHFFCENNVDLGSTVHGLRRMNESPEFVKVKEVYDNNIANNNIAAAVSAMKEYMQKFADVPQTLLNTDEAPELIAEITPWLKAMNYMGECGLCLMNMQTALLDEKPEMFIEEYLRYEELKKAQDALISRDFEGTLKSAKPEVATVHVAPFIKSELGNLVTTYKSRYDYRVDVFPAQEIENGTYFIMYNGAYLTNSTPNVAKSVPQFVKERDDVRPQRQEWKISLDPQTNRYKIVNAEDNRYLNENGMFTANESTNPYEAAWHTYNIRRLANGKYSIQNAGSAGDKFWTANSRVEQSSSNKVLPDNFIFDIVPISGAKEETLLDTDAILYIKDGNKYLTNNNPNGSGGEPSFKEVEKPGVAQEWRITQDANGENCYKITSNADGRYVNEYGAFGTNAYFPDWNTYVILLRDGMYSIQTTQQSAKDGVRYWNTKTGRLEQDNGLDESSSYLIQIVDKNKDTETGIKPVSKKKIEIANGFIRTENNVSSIVVYDTKGCKQKAINNSNALNILDLQKGVYIVIVNDINHIASYKFVIE